MNYERLKIVALVAYIVLLLLNNKYPTPSYITWKNTIVDTYSTLYLISFFKYAKELQQQFTFEIGDSQ